MEWDLKVMSGKRHEAKESLYAQLPKGSKRLITALEHLINMLPGELDGDITIQTRGSVGHDSACHLSISVAAAVKKPQWQRAREAKAEEERLSQQVQEALSGQG